MRGFNKFHAQGHDLKGFILKNRIFGGTFSEGVDAKDALFFLNGSKLRLVLQKPESVNL